MSARNIFLITLIFLTRRRQCPADSSRPHAHRRYIIYILFRRTYRNPVPARALFDINAESFKRCCFICFGYQRIYMFIYIFFFITLDSEQRGMHYFYNGGVFFFFARTQTFGYYYNCNKSFTQYLSNQIRNWTWKVL